MSEPLCVASPLFGFLSRQIRHIHTEDKVSLLKEGDYCPECLQHILDTKWGELILLGVPFTGSIHRGLYKNTIVVGIEGPVTHRDRIVATLGVPGHLVRIEVVTSAKVHDTPV